MTGLRGAEREREGGDEGTADGKYSLHSSLTDSVPELSPTEMGTAGL